MAGTRHTDVEAAQMYRKATELLQSGRTIPQTCRELGISAATFHRWRRKFGAMLEPRGAERADWIRTRLDQPEEGGRLERLEKENNRLKLLLAELALENAFLKDALETKRP